MSKGRIHQVIPPDIIPPDIITEILIRTDIEYLPPLRWVCKEWRRLLSDPHFISRHYQNAKNVCGYISDNTSVDKYDACRSYDIYFVPHPRSPSSDPLPSLTFMSEPVQIKASTSQGLLLCFGLFNECYYVCKPTTQEWATIPITQDTQTYTIRMVMSVASSSPLRFRIMRITSYRKSLQLKCEIFDSDSCGMWKTIEGVAPLLCGNRHTCPSIVKGVMVDGLFFWLDRTGIYVVTKIMCIDMWKEEGKSLMLPADVASEDASFKSHKKLSNLNGGLGLVRCEGMVHYDIWLLSSVVDQKWEKIRVFNTNNDSLLRIVEYGWMMTDYIVENMILTGPVIRGRGTFWYNFQEEKLIPTSANYLNESDLYFFQSDFFPCNINECPFNNCVLN